MSNIVKKTIKKSFINRHAGEAVQYALKMEREGAKLLGLNGGARMLQLTHEVNVEEDLEVNIKDEEVLDEPTTEAISTEDVSEDTPEDVPESEVLEVVSEDEATAVDLDYAETLDKDELLSYLKGVDESFDSKAKSAKSILKAAKKHFNV
jgi:hypothetical protein